MHPVADIADEGIAYRVKHPHRQQHGADERQRDAKLTVIGGHEDVDGQGEGGEGHARQGVPPLLGCGDFHGCGIRRGPA